MPMRGPSFQEPLQWLPESFFSLPFIIVRKQHKLALILTHHNPPTRRGMFLCLERQRKAETLMKCSPPLSGHLWLFSHNTFIFSPCCGGTVGQARREPGLTDRNWTSTVARDQLLWSQSLQLLASQSQQRTGKQRNLTEQKESQRKCVLSDG